MDDKEAVEKLLQQGELPTPANIEILKENNTALSDKKEQKQNTGSNVEVIENVQHTPKKIVVGDFTRYFKWRYNFLKNLLINRPGTDLATSISKLSGLKEATVIAYISDMKKMPSGAVRLCLEDLSGTIDAVIPLKEEEMVKVARYLTQDEVLAFKGGIGRNVMYINEIIWPDVPQKTLLKTPDEIYAVFTGDLHVGSNMFLPNNLRKFIKWLRGEIGSEDQKQIAKKTKYIFIVGDIVDGVGVYPEQDKELDIKDIYQQYEAAAKYLKQIPEDKQIILIPGNHDAMRIAEPQPPLPKDLAAPIYELPNITILGNPSTVNIHKQEDFPGINVLMYHGYSFDYFVDSIEALREAGGYDAPDKLIEFLLKRRHLAPTYGASLALPIQPDPLLIKQIPNIVVTGHIHKAKIGQYKNILTISASCWQARTSFQEKVGHHPDPCYVPLVNLQTGNAKMLNFN